MMMNLRLLPTFALTLAMLAPALTWAPSAQAATLSDAGAKKVIKTVITAIRYGKDDLAAKQVAFAPMAKAMLGDYWAKADANQQKQIISDLEKVIRGISFKKGRDMFKHLDAILYAPVKMNGDKAVVKTTVVVNKNYKKAEIVIDFVLVEDSGKWKIMDTIMLGDATTEVIHEDQVEPIFEDGGIKAVVDALAKKAAEVK